MDPLQFLRDNPWATPVPVLLAVLGLLAALARWLYRQQRTRRTRLDTFPFELVPPYSYVMPVLMPFSIHDPLPDISVPYQQRMTRRSISGELQTALEIKRAVLILGSSGLGKTREAAELAQTLNHNGWAILKVILKNKEWIDEPAHFPTEHISQNKKIVFFLDDLNQLVYGGQQEQHPNADIDSKLSLTQPIPPRLIRMLDYYEKQLRPENVRIVATARNDREPETQGQPSEWDKLEFDHYPAFRARFVEYALPAPDVKAVASVIRETASKEGIQNELNDNDFEQLAREYDGTFRNVVESLRNFKKDQRALTLEAFGRDLKATARMKPRESVASPDREVGGGGLVRNIVFLVISFFLVANLAGRLDIRLDDTSVVAGILIAALVGMANMAWDWFFSGIAPPPVDVIGGKRVPRPPDEVYRYAVEATGAMVKGVVIVLLVIFAILSIRYPEIDIIGTIEANISEIARVLGVSR